MADITDMVNATGAGQAVAAESPETILSPEIRRAMDIIFPQSAVQLLQEGGLLATDACPDIVACDENIYSNTSTSVAPSVSDTVTSNCASVGHITTLTTATTVTGAPVDVLTKSFGNGSPNGFTSPLSTNSSAETLTSFIIQDVRTDSGIESNDTSSGSTKKNMARSKITKADLEIINSFDVSVDLSSSECHSRGGSDSEDMRRPFASIAREKKKKKKKKHNSDSVNSNCSSSETNETMHTELKSASELCLRNDISSICPSNSNSPLSVQDFVCDTNLSNQNMGHESFSCNSLIKKCSAGVNNRDSDSQSWIVENGSVSSESFDKNSVMITEDISNISFSSTKENQNQGARLRQILPRVKGLRFHIIKHKQKIKKTFLPCFIVVKKLHAISRLNLVKDCSLDIILPLSVRLKHLSDLCDQGFIKCQKKESGELIYRNIFEETVLPDIPEDQFESSRRRNLRKRDKNISYVEPSEDDILDEFSRKRYRTKHKDAVSASEDERAGENKKKKKHVSVSESKTTTSDTVVSVSVTHAQENSGKTTVTESKKDAGEGSNIKTLPHKSKVNGKGTDKANEIIVYPPVSLGSQNFYCARDAAAAKCLLAKSTQEAKQKPNSSIQFSPPSTNITILPTTTVSGTFTHYSSPVSLFSSLPIGIPGSLPTQTVVPGAVISTQTPTTGGMKKPPQYCVVKMDGKDVLLQIVSSSGLGTPVPVVMPKGKAVYAPPAPLVAGPAHLFGQQIVSHPRLAHTLPVPVTPVVTMSQGTITSTTSLQSLVGMQVMSRPLTSTSSSNVALSALPVIQTAQLAGLANTSSVRPLNLSPSAQQTSSAPTCLLAPVNVLSSSSPGTLVTSVSSTSRSISSLPTSITSMAAPNTTTVVRTVRVPNPSLRTIVPNQSTSLRSFRIFVPGCSATGTPSRFATLGSFANSSPLTHLSASSILLPQRKRSSDQELTPEQRAAKRRKLEKKYPLPPGVVIKTEPLDTPPKPSPVISTVSGSRSLLSQNLHLLSTSRPGTNFQSIRIISPSLAGSLSAKNLRGNSNIIYRATSIGGGQTILLPTSLGQISTRTTTTITSSVTSTLPLATSVSEPAVANARKAATTNLANTNDTPVTSSISFSSARALSESHPPSPGANAPTSVSASAEAQEPEISMSSTVMPSETTNAVDTSSASPLDTACEPSRTSQSPAAAEHLRSHSSSPSLASAQGPHEAGTLQNVLNGLEELRKFIQVQEVCGLKGERLDKLKALLCKKEEQYQNMLSCGGDTSFLPASKTNGDIAGDGGDLREHSTVSFDGPGCSETDPFVID